MGEIVRLQKYISMCGEASRREAERLIAEGKISVNGKKITEMGVKVEIGSDKVCLSGRELKPCSKKYYIMLNKPSGYVTTVKDQFERPAVCDLVSRDISARLVPVGRLDYETEGLLLMTNDGDFVNRVTHPKYNVGKTYYAEVSGGLNIKNLARLRKGVKIDDYVTSPCEIEVLDAHKGTTFVNITIHEGRNRQVRKMFKAVGCRVDYLRRIKIGTVELGNLPLGRWRHLTSHEISYLMKNGGATK